MEARGTPGYLPAEVADSCLRTLKDVRYNLCLKVPHNLYIDRTPKQRRFACCSRAGHVYR